MIRLSGLVECGAAGADGTRSVATIDGEDVVEAFEHLDGLQVLVVLDVNWEQAFYCEGKASIGTGWPTNLDWFYVAVTDVLRVVQSCEGEDVTLTVVPLVEPRRPERAT